MTISVRPWLFSQHFSCFPSFYASSIFSSRPPYLSIFSLSPFFILVYLPVSLFLVLCHTFFYKIFKHFQSTYFQYGFNIWRFKFAINLLISDTHIFSLNFYDNVAMIKPDFVVAFLYFMR